MLDAIVAALLPLVEQYGYPALFLGALLEHTVLLGAFLPGATFVALGGLLAQQGYLRFEHVVAVTALGSLLGDHVDYVLGRRMPRGTRWEQRLSTYVVYAERLIHRWGGFALVGAKFFNTTRSVIAVGAGFCRMPYRRFLAFDLLAALLWGLTYTTGGYLLGWLVAYWYVGIVVGPLAALALWRWRARLRAMLLGDERLPEAQEGALRGVD
ncbi:MAG: DedA family protein [Chloroflexi bacterium]|nr:DedA family protein [Chloroflexota bacterium]